MCDLDDIKEKIRAAMESQGTYTHSKEAVQANNKRMTERFADRFLQGEK